MVCKCVRSLEVTAHPVLRHIVVFGISEPSPWFTVAWQEQHQSTSFQHPMPGGINQLKHRQYPRAFRFGNGNRINAIGFDDLAKFCFEQLKPFGISGFVSFDKNLRLAAANALLRIAGIGKIMSAFQKSAWSFHSFALSSASST